MDDLMKLTGLRKVKNSTLDIFKAALKFSQLDPEVQAANPKSLNFCFLGNAVSFGTLMRIENSVPVFCNPGLSFQETSRVTEEDPPLKMNDWEGNPP